MDYLAVERNKSINLLCMLYTINHLFILWVNNEAHAFVRICKLSFVRKALTGVCPNRNLEYCHLSESYFGILSFVRIVIWNIVICPNRILEYCHLSES